MTTTSATEPLPDGDLHEMEHLWVPVDSLTPYNRNPRRGDVERIMESLRVHGQYRPIVVNIRDGADVVLAGNHTWHAVKELGWERIARTTVDVDEDTAARIVLVDNRTNDLAGYEDEVLVQLLIEMDASERGLEGTGFRANELDELIAAAEAADADDERGDMLEVVDVALPEPTTVTAKGDVWRLGHHTLVVATVLDEWDQWVGHLTDGALFLPYPGAFVTLAERAVETPLVMVQPDTYIAGQIIDKWAQFTGDTPEKVTK